MNSEFIKKFVADQFHRIGSRINEGTCEMTQEQMINLMSIIAHEPVSKVEAMRFLQIDRNKFDYLLRNGRLPDGQRITGFKEHVWYKDELFEAGLKEGLKPKGF